MTISLFFVLSIASVGFSLPVVLIDEPQFDTIDLSALGPGLFSDPDESVGRAVNDWLPEHGVNPEELGTYLEGDMLVPGIEGRNGLVKTSSRWPNGIVPYVISNDFSAGSRNKILSAMAEYHRMTCVKFVPRSNEKDYVYFGSTNTGCWSSVGKVGGKQTINLQDPGCVSSIGTPAHEMMHAIGFLHEQNRYDRDGYIRVLTQNIKPETLTNFEKAQAGETTEFGVAYNTGSVMHYSSTAFSKNGQKTIEALSGTGRMGQRDGFAQSDVEKINRMYCDAPNNGGPGFSGPNNGVGPSNGGPNNGPSQPNGGNAVSRFPYPDYGAYGPPGIGPGGYGPGIGPGAYGPGGYGPPGIGPGGYGPGIGPGGYPPYGPGAYGPPGIGGGYPPYGPGGYGPGIGPGGYPPPGIGPYGPGYRPGYPPYYSEYDSSPDKGLMDEEENVNTL